MQKLKHHSGVCTNSLSIRCCSRPISFAPKRPTISNRAYSLMVPAHDPQRWGHFSIHSLGCCGGRLWSPGLRRAAGRAEHPHPGRRAARTCDLYIRATCHRSDRTCTHAHHPSVPACSDRISISPHTTSPFGRAERLHNYNFHSGACAFS